MALLAVPLTSASAGDDDAGYNSSDTDTVTIGSDPNTGGQRNKTTMRCSRSSKGLRSSNRATTLRRITIRLTIQLTPTIPGGTSGQFCLDQYRARLCA
jgi:hypothetical protein